MVQKANPRLIGVFILTAFFVFIATFLLINQDRFFSRSIKYVMYFQGSIKGLNVGSPVMFNGVQIGRVIGISLVTDLQTTELQIPVYVEINQNNFIVLDVKSRRKEDLREITDNLIAKGLRAKLEMQSILTGQMMVGISFYPDTPVVLQGHNPKIIEVPTLPSTSEELIQTLQKLPLRETMGNMNTLLLEADKLLKLINNDTPSVMKDISVLTHSLAAVSQKVEKTLGSFDEDSRTMLDLNKMLRDFSAAAQSLRNWSDYLERHPEALLRGKGGSR